MPQDTAFPTPHCGLPLQQGNGRDQPELGVYESTTTGPPLQSSLFLPDGRAVPEAGAPLPDFFSDSSAVGPPVKPRNRVSKPGGPTDARAGRTCVALGWHTCRSSAHNSKPGLDQRVQGMGGRSIVVGGSGPGASSGRARDCAAHAALLGPMTMARPFGCGSGPMRAAQRVGCSWSRGEKWGNSRRAVHTACCRGDFGQGPWGPCSTRAHCCSAT